MSFKLGSVILIVLVSIAISSGAAVPKCSECPTEFAPVCGSDGITWPNRCILECHIPILNEDIKVVNEGICASAKTNAAQSTTTDADAKSAQEETEVTGAKACACVRNFAPVCGTDGVTYANICQLRCARQKNANLEVQRQGSCDKNKRNKRALYDNRYNYHRAAPCSY